MYPLYDVMRRAIPLCGGLSQNPDPKQNVRKTSEQLKLRDILQNTWPVPFKTVKVMKYHHRTATQEMWDSVRCGIQRRILKQKKRTLMEKLVKS